MNKCPECGHPVSHHRSGFGCIHMDESGNHVFCSCMKNPIDFQVGGENNRFLLFLSRILYVIILWLWPDIFSGWTRQSLNTTYAWTAFRTNWLIKDKANAWYMIRSAIYYHTGIMLTGENGPLMLSWAIGNRFFFYDKINHKFFTFKRQMRPLEKKVDSGILD